MIEVRDYLTPEGRTPFAEWFGRLRDKRAQTFVARRLTRLEAGLFGDCEPVGEGVLELRIDYGPGYRVYFGRHGTAVVLLLCGGDKRRQNDDIKRAKGYWQEFKSRKD